MTKMEWKNLLSSEREPKSKISIYRNCFDMDYQRIIPFFFEKIAR